MTTGLTAVVAGLPGLADRLRATGQFSTIFETDSVSGFRDLVRGAMKGSATKDNTVLIFGDDIRDDLPEMNFDRILSGLSTWRVVLVERTPNASALAQRHPHVGLLRTPLTLNLLLGGISSAIAGLPGAPALSPVQDGFETLDFDAPQGVVPAALAPAWGTTAPQDTPAPTPVAESPTVAFPVPQPPAEQPTPAVLDAWGPPAPAEAPPTPVAEPAVPAVTPWSNATSVPAFPEPAPAFTTPPNTPAPATQAAPDAWSQAAQAEAQPVSALPVALRPLAGPAWGAQAGPAGPALRGGEQRIMPAGPQRRGWVITVTAPKGGVGKSSFSLNLAVALALRLRAQGKTVCLVDANFQQADIAKYLDLFNAPTIVNLAMDPTLRSRDRIMGSLAHVPQYNLHCLLGPSSTTEATPASIHSRLYNEVVTLLKEKFDYIIIDTPVAERYHDILADFAVPIADYLVVPTIPSIQTLINVNRWLGEAVVTPKSAGGLGIPIDRIGVVLNRAEDDVDCDEEDVRGELGRWTFLGTIPESREWKRANNRNEVAAAGNYADLNEALRHILFKATTDPTTGAYEAALAPGTAIETQRKGGGLLSRLRGRKAG